MKVNGLISPIYSPHKTTRRNFGLSNITLKQRLYYRRRRNKFTGKELDPETGLYYYGARYLDPKTSRWLSGDPALGEYFPVAPVNDDTKKRNGNLPGQGGVFNYVNLHVYHYAGNNPVKYVDPDGKASYSYKQKENCYTFFAESTVLEGVIFGGTGFVIGLGIGSKIALKIAGFEKIEINNTVAMLEKISGKLYDAIEAIQISALFGKDLVGTAGLLKEFATKAGNVLATYDTVMALTKQNEIGVDNMIRELWGDDLSAKSHNGVITLYKHALSRFDEMVKSGELKYTINYFGKATINFCIGADKVKQELQELRNQMNQNPEW